MELQLVITTPPGDLYFNRYYEVFIFVAPTPTGGGGTELGNQPLQINGVQEEPVCKFFQDSWNKLIRRECGRQVGSDNFPMNASEFPLFLGKINRKYIF